MHKETMLYHIYERIANKTLTAWCKIKYTEIIDDYWLVLEEYYELWNVYMDDWNGENSIEPMVIQCIDYIRDLSYEWRDNFRESIYPITINDVNNNYGNNYRIIWHPVMIGDVLDWAEKTICTNRSRECPLCWWELYEEENERWDFWRIYQKWYYACEDRKWCGFFTHNSSSENNGYYECNWDVLNVCRDFNVPEYFGRKISDKIYDDIADMAYGWIQDSISTYREEKRRPIEDQPIECIEYIYNLLG